MRRVSEQSRAKFSSDSSRVLYDAVGMAGNAIRRAALTTLRRAICERFPPGAERAERLAWLAVFQEKAKTRRLLRGVRYSAGVVLSITSRR